MRGLVVVLVLLAAAGCAGTNETPPGSDARPSNELPMYGNVENTPARESIDRHEVLSSGRTRAQASMEAVRLGWDYHGAGDFATAMRRFNQAWLLDPDNGGAYWGFAVILIDRDNDFEGAKAMFERALALLPREAMLYNDYGKFLGRNGRPREALAPLLKSLELNPIRHEAHKDLSIAYLELNNHERALHHAQMAKHFGAEISSRFIRGLACIVEAEAQGAGPAEIESRCGDR